MMPYANVATDKGIIHVHSMTVPYENVQNVQKEQNVLDMLLGLCTIKVETAGSITANVEIPGIDVNDNLDEIILRRKKEILKKTKSGGVGEKELLSEIEKAIIILSDEISSLRTDFNMFIEKFEKITTTMYTAQSSKEKIGVDIEKLSEEELSGTAVVKKMEAKTKTKKKRKTKKTRKAKSKNKTKKSKTKGRQK